MITLGSYEPDSDGGKNDDEDYQSDEVESEVEEDDDGVAEDEEVRIFSHSYCFDFHT